MGLSKHSSLSCRYSNDVCRSCGVLKDNGTISIRKITVQELAHATIMNDTKIFHITSVALNSSKNDGTYSLADLRSILMAICIPLIEVSNVFKWKNIFIFMALTVFKGNK